MTRSQHSAEAVLPARSTRRPEAEAWLGDMLKAWGVRSASTGRWLSPAQHALDSDVELVMFAQYDSELFLFTVELWQDGQRVYGIDDWLG